MSARAVAAGPGEGLPPGPERIHLGRTPARHRQKTFDLGTALERCLYAGAGHLKTREDSAWRVQVRAQPGQATLPPGCAECDGRQCGESPAVLRRFGQQSYED